MTCKMLEMKLIPPCKNQVTLIIKKYILLFLLSYNKLLRNKEPDKSLKIEQSSSYYNNDMNLILREKL